MLCNVIIKIIGNLFQTIDEFNCILCIFQCWFLLYITYQQCEVLWHDFILLFVFWWHLLHQDIYQIHFMFYLPLDVPIKHNSIIHAMLYVGGIWQISLPPTWNRSFFHHTSTCITWFQTILVLDWFDVKICISSWNFICVSAAVALLTWCLLNFKVY